MFWFLGWEACGIVAFEPGIKPSRTALEGEVFKKKNKSFLLCMGYKQLTTMR